MMNYVSYHYYDESDKCHMLIAEDGKSTAKLWLIGQTPDYMLISDLKVHTSIRRQGRAADLMHTMEQLAAKSKALYLQLYTNNDWHKSWYKRLGYKCIKKCRHYSIMEKSISEIVAC